MELTDDGFSRPVRTDPLSGAGTVARPVADATKIFADSCPGRRVASPRPDGAVIHPTLGPVIEAWEAWAADSAIRSRGSSGGTLTALTSWLVETGQLSGVAGAGADAGQPRRTVPVQITTRAEALAAAGSRYAPVSTLSVQGADPFAPDGGLVGKPCEIAAARAQLKHQPDGESEPLLLSFFCAGTPSQTATDRLVTKLGLPAETELSDLWYRGRGWPGRFTAVAADGNEVSASYDESWGKHLGPAVQWRCKICPDGVGESADISAADYWQTDERGYPVFDEEEGRSALLARTPRGREVIERAFTEGVLIGRPLGLDRIAGVQPLQVSRRSTLLGRLVGTLLAGRPVPRFTGFGLAALAGRNARQSIRIGRGSFRRVRAFTEKVPPR